MFHCLALAACGGIITYGSWLYDPYFGAVIGLCNMVLVWYVSKEEL